MVHSGVIDKTHSAKDFAVFLPFVKNVKMAFFHKGICCHKLRALLHSYVFFSRTVGNSLFAHHSRSGVNILSSQRNYAPLQGGFLPDRHVQRACFLLRTCNHQSSQGPVFLTAASTPSRIFNTMSSCKVGNFNY